MPQRKADGNADSGANPSEHGADPKTRADFSEEHRIGVLRLFNGLPER